VGFSVVADERTYQLLDDKDRKPVSFARLQRLAQTGRLSRVSFVREEGTQQWLTADQVEGLQFNGPSSSDLHESDPREGQTPSEVPLPAEYQTEPSVEPAERSSRFHDEMDEFYAEEGENSRGESPPPKRRRIQVWFLLVTLGLVIGVPLVAWYVLAPTPAERFVVFADMARERLAATVADEAGKEAFRAYYRYDVTKPELTQSVLSLYRAQIVLQMNDYAAQYDYEYRNGRWSCVGAIFRQKDGKTTLRRGARLRATETGKILAVCGRY